MISVLHKTKVNGSVLSCAIAEDRILVLDSLYHFYELDASDMSFSKSVQVFKGKAPRHKFSHALSTSVNGYFFCSYSGSHIGHAYEDSKSLKKVTTLEWHRATINSSKFCRNGQFLATGGEDGKAFIYQVPSFKLIASLPPHPDYIVSLIFDAQGNKLGVSSFDCSLAILDIERGSIVAKLEIGSVIEDGAFINQDKALFFICKDGRIGKYDLELKELSFQTISKDWLTRMKLTTDRRHAVVGTRSNTFYIVRVDDLELLYTVTVEHNGISAIELTADRLILGYIDGCIEFYNIKKSLDIFEGLISEGKLFDAIKLTKDDNIFLSLLPMYRDAMEKQWRVTIKEAIDLLATNRFKEAVDLVAPFMDDKHKKEEFNQYAQQIQAVASFCDAWEKKDVQAAYKIAEQTPEVCKLPFYDMLEDYFNQIFNIAKARLMEDPTGNMNKAQKLLKPFATVKSKKDIVEALLKDSKSFQKADTLLKERKFSDFFVLAERHPIIKQTHSYNKAMCAIPQVVDRINLLRSDKNYEKAMELSIFLASLIPFKDVGEENIRLIDKQKIFLEAIEGNQIKQAYELATQELKLQALPEYSDLNNRFRELAKEATNMAGDGYSSKALELLQPYMEVEMWKKRIASIMRIAYLYELDIAAQSKSLYADVDWTKSVAVYLDRFGLDEEVLCVCQTRGLMENLGHNKGTPNGYRKLPYVTTVLVKKDSDGGAPDIDALLAEAQQG